MKVDALVCARCGAPLGLVAALPALVGCEFCGATISVSREASVVTKEGAPDELRAQRARESKVAFSQELARLIAKGCGPYDAIRQASAAHLGAAGQTPAVARVTLALAAEFERDKGVDLARKPTALARIAEGYLKVSEALQTSSEESINLPFLEVSPDGPVHFERRVTPALLAQLAARDPEAPPARRASSPGDALDSGSRAQKRWWWPF